MRDGQFDGRIMQVAQFPTARFTLTSPIALGAHTKAGTTIAASATGQLTLHGVTRRITFPVMARYTSVAIEINGSIPVTFSDYKISDPSFVGINVDPDGQLEFLLTLHSGAA
jgi:polyisoprenoid-binding protein YceI